MLAYGGLLVKCQKKLNSTEQNYHDELLTLAPDGCAANWWGVINNAPGTPASQDYYAYWGGLNPEAKEESEYAIFSSMYDVVADHQAYEVEFDAVGYSLVPKCKRKKTH